jgi:ABC-type lipoprotein release transport system permease subunit
VASLVIAPPLIVVLALAASAAPAWSASRAGAVSVLREQ